MKAEGESAFKKAKRNAVTGRQHMTLFPRMKASPYLARSCPSTYLDKGKEKQTVSEKVGRKECGVEGWRWLREVL